MINLAVIEMKDIIKYLVRITIMITIVVALTRYFSSFRTNLKNSAEEMKEQSFLGCLDMVIPSIENINHHEDKTSTSNSKGPLKMALEVELGMMNSLENKKQENKEEKTNVADKKNEEEEIQEAKTRCRNTSTKK